MTIETRAQRRLLGGDGITARHDDEVGRHEIELSERFAGEASYAIAIDGATRDAAGDGKTESCTIDVIDLREHREKPVG
jgi:hypothetical protein